MIIYPTKSWSRINILYTISLTSIIFKFVSDFYYWPKLKPDFMWSKEIFYFPWTCPWRSYDLIILDIIEHHETRIRFDIWGKLWDRFSEFIFFDLMFPNFYLSIEVSLKWIEEWHFRSSQEIKAYKVWGVDLVYWVAWQCSLSRSQSY